MVTARVARLQEWLGRLIGHHGMAVNEVLLLATGNLPRRASPDDRTRRACACTQQRSLPLVVLVAAAFEERRAQWAISPLTLCGVSV